MFDREEVERIHRESYATYPLDLLEFVVRDPEMHQRVQRAEDALWLATMLRDVARDELRRRQEADHA